MKSLKTFLLVALLALSSSAFAGKVNVNTADADSIAMEMNGIGQNRAQAIVDYRKANGKFRSIDDLTRVKGVGAKTIEKNRNKIML
ncbi:MAG TPA: ComEA family DNA-binding protein [Thiotrichales bacterium]|nr:ComEA family DNA-binding protein [Thiotrichales bacterium]